MIEIESNRKEYESLHSYIFEELGDLMNAWLIPETLILKTPV